VEGLPDPLLGLRDDLWVVQMLRPYEFAATAAARLPLSATTAVFRSVNGFSSAAVAPLSSAASIPCDGRCHHDL